MHPQDANDTGFRGQPLQIETAEMENLLSVGSGANAKFAIEYTLVERSSKMNFICRGKYFIPRGSDSRTFPNGGVA